MKKTYKTMTVQELVDFVMNNPEVFKKGMKTKIFSGDFECNNTHIFHEFQHLHHNCENVVVLGYEKHENMGE